MRILLLRAGAAGRLEISGPPAEVYNKVTTISHSPKNWLLSSPYCEKNPETNLRIHQKWMLNAVEFILKSSMKYAMMFPSSSYVCHTETAQLKGVKPFQSSLLNLRLWGLRGVFLATFTNLSDQNSTDTFWVCLKMLCKPLFTQWFC